MENDIRTCLQVVIYAYLMEQKGFTVSGGEYRYIRLGKTVSCSYDEGMKSELSRLLEQFKSSMLSGDFPAAGTAEGEGDPCRYCKYKAVCGKENDEEGKED